METRWKELMAAMDNPELTEEQEADIIEELEVIEQALGTETVEELIQN